MKKIALLALAVFMMVGCRYKRTDANVTLASDPVIVVDENTQDSCEYYPSYGHKGNCKFCAERRKKELDSLTIKIWNGFPGFDTVKIEIDPKLNMHLNVII